MNKKALIKEIRNHPKGSTMLSLGYSPFFIHKVLVENIVKESPAEIAKLEAQIKKQQERKLYPGQPEDIERNKIVKQLQQQVDQLKAAQTKQEPENKQPENEEESSLVTRIASGTREYTESASTLCTYLALGGTGIAILLAMVPYIGWIISPIALFVAKVIGVIGTGLDGVALGLSIVEGNKEAMVTNGAALAVGVGVALIPGGEAAKTAGKEAAKNIGKEAAKDVGKEAAKAATKTGAKEAEKTILQKLSAWFSKNMGREAFEDIFHATLKDGAENVGKEAFQKVLTKEASKAGTEKAARKIIENPEEAVQEIVKEKVGKDIEGAIGKDLKEILIDGKKLNGKEEVKNYIQKNAGLVKADVNGSREYHTVAGLKKIAENARKETITATQKKIESEINRVKGKPEEVKKLQQEAKKIQIAQGYGFDFDVDLKSIASDVESSEKTTDAEQKPEKTSDIDPDDPYAELKQQYGESEFMKAVTDEKDKAVVYKFLKALKDEGVLKEGQSSADFKELMKLIRQDKLTDSDKFIRAMQSLKGKEHLIIVKHLKSNYEQFKQMLQQEKKEEPGASEEKLNPKLQKEAREKYKNSYDYFKENFLTATYLDDQGKAFKPLFIIISELSGMKEPDRKLALTRRNFAKNESLIKEEQANDEVLNLYRKAVIPQTNKMQRNTDKIMEILEAYREYVGGGKITGGSKKLFRKYGEMDPKKLLYKVIQATMKDIATLEEILEQYEGMSDSSEEPKPTEDEAPKRDDLLNERTDEEIEADVDQMIASVEEVYNFIIGEGPARAIYNSITDTATGKQREEKPKGLEEQIIYEVIKILEDEKTEAESEEPKSEDPSNIMELAKQVYDKMVTIKEYFPNVSPFKTNYEIDQAVEGMKETLKGFIDIVVDINNDAKDRRVLRDVTELKRILKAIKENLKEFFGVSEFVKKAKEAGALNQKGQDAVNSGEAKSTEDALNANNLTNKNVLKTSGFEDLVMDVLNNAYDNNEVVDMLLQFLESPKEGFIDKLKKGFKSLRSKLSLEENKSQEEVKEIYFDYIKLVLRDLLLLDKKRGQPGLEDEVKKKLTAIANSKQYRETKEQITAGTVLDVEDDKEFFKRRTDKEFEDLMMKPAQIQGIFRKAKIFFSRLSGRDNFRGIFVLYFLAQALLRYDVIRNKDDFDLTTDDMSLIDKYSKNPDQKELLQTFFDEFDINKVVDQDEDETPKRDDSYSKLQEQIIKEVIGLLLKESLQPIQDDLESKLGKELANKFVSHYINFLKTIKEDEKQWLTGTIIKMASEDFESLKNLIDPPSTTDVEFDPEEDDKETDEDNKETDEDGKGAQTQDVVEQFEDQYAERVLAIRQFIDNNDEIKIKTHEGRTFLVHRVKINTKFEKIKKDLAGDGMENTELQLNRFEQYVSGLENALEEYGFNVPATQNAQFDPNEDDKETDKDDKENVGLTADDVKKDEDLNAFMNDAKLIDTEKEILQDFFASLDDPEIPLEEQILREVIKLLKEEPEDEDGDGLGTEYPLKELVDKYIKMQNDDPAQKDLLISALKKLKKYDSEKFETFVKKYDKPKETETSKDIESKKELPDDYTERVKKIGQFINDNSTDVVVLTTQVSDLGINFQSVGVEIAKKHQDFIKKQKSGEITDEEKNEFDEYITKIEQAIEAQKELANDFDSDDDNEEQDDLPQVGDMYKYTGRFTDYTNNLRVNKKYEIEQIDGSKVKFKNHTKSNRDNTEVGFIPWDQLKDNMKKVEEQESETGDQTSPENIELLEQFLNLEEIKPLLQQDNREVIKNITVNMVNREPTPTQDPEKYIYDELLHERLRQIFLSVKENDDPKMSKESNEVVIKSIKRDIKELKEFLNTDYDELIQRDYNNSHFELYVENIMANIYDIVQIIEKVTEAVETKDPSKIKTAEKEVMDKYDFEKEGEKEDLFDDDEEAEEKQESGTGSDLSEIIQVLEEVKILKDKYYNQDSENYRFKDNQTLAKIDKINEWHKQSDLIYDYEAKKSDSIGGKLREKMDDYFSKQKQDIINLKNSLNNKDKFIENGKEFDKKNEKLKELFDEALSPFVSLMVPKLFSAFNPRGEKMKIASKHQWLGSDESERNKILYIQSAGIEPSKEVFKTSKNDSQGDPNFDFIPGIVGVNLE